MPVYIRFCEGKRWGASSRFADGELTADTIGDLRTTNNTLSLYRLHEDKSNKDEILFGFFSERVKKTGKWVRRLDLEYFELDEAFLAELGLRAPREAPCDYVGGKYHCNLERLQARDLPRLADGLAALIPKPQLPQQIRKTYERLVRRRIVQEDVVIAELLGRYGSREEP